jgi:hypothetical protein
MVNNNQNEPDDQNNQQSSPDALTDEQDQIYLFDETTTTSNERVQETQTKRLTALPGIDEATARTLGDDINRIEDLLSIADGTLKSDVRSAVPSHYHNTLRSVLRDLYCKALSNRSASEWRPVDKKYLAGNCDWSDPAGDIDSADEADLICHLLRNDTEPGDRFSVNVEQYGDINIQVVETGGDETKLLGVTVEPASTPLGSEVIIEIPQSYKQEYPTIRHEHDSTESDPPLIDGSPTVVHTRDITAVERREKAP